MKTSKQKATEYIERLERRRNFLRRRDFRNSYDKAELSALDWAIPILLMYASREEQ